ncbi:MAG: SMC family ATPase [Dehalococcoidia bacterium]|nr:SMC family ATPase [Dehalococcoidia bacterium]
MPVGHGFGDTALVLPLSLRVKNFLSYREDAPVLHLEGVRVACLCGANGHGKSALLDAITWALWGRARGHRLEQLIHQGEREMAVELEFEIEAGGPRYRVARRYSRTRSAAQSSLELTVASSGGWQPITANAVTATEAEIERRLNMDYETFVNSAYLVQGRADLFAMATPGKRKDVLSRVLGLDVYDRLSDRARQKSRALQGRVDAQDVELERIDQVAAALPEAQTRLAEAFAELESAQREEASAAERLDLMRRQAAQMEERSREADALAERAQRERARADEARQEAEALGTRIEGWRADIANQAETKAGFDAYHAARRRFDESVERARQADALRAELRPLQERVAAARSRLEVEAASLRTRLEQELEPRALTLSAVETRLASINAEAQAAEREAAAATTLAVQSQDASAEARRLQDELARIKSEGDETRAKLKMMEQHGHDDGAICPLCATRLGEDGRAHVESGYHERIDELLDQHAAQSEAHKRAEAQSRDLAAQAQTAQRHADAERRNLDAERARLSEQREGALRAQAQAQETRAQLAETESALERGDYEREAQAQAEALRERERALAADPQEQESLRDAVRALERWDAEHRRLDEAQRRLAEDEASLEGAAARAQEHADELERIEAQRRRIAEQVAELPALRERAVQLEAEHAQAARRRDELLERRTRLAAEVTRAEQAQAEAAERRKQREALRKQTSVYNDLATAFGRGGVQALLIEAAVPRLEDAANELLSRMTDGRMSLKIETQRQRRTGRAAGAEAVETLEILIADDTGTREYEMFSGGERFRVDFALRIALSRLLAWRAGARLPTLFIDEGFGTQDAQGRDRIVEAIGAIEDSFERILVITHMDEIKEAFPVRIEVTRTPETGSTFAIT